MKRLPGFVLAAGLVLFAGCFTAALPDSVLPMTKNASAAKALPPVRAEQVTPTNGHQTAQALEDEMAREEQRNALSTESR